jgi:hypothetical protein
MAQFWLQLAQYAEEQEAQQACDTAVYDCRQGKSDLSESSE